MQSTQTVSITTASGDTSDLSDAQLSITDASSSSSPPASVQSDKNVTTDAVQRRIQIPTDTIQELLTEISPERFSDYDKFEHGLSHTSTGYSYNPQLLSAAQTREMSHLIINFRAKPNKFIKMIKKIRTALP